MLMMREAKPKTNERVQKPKRQERNWESRGCEKPKPKRNWECRGCEKPKPKATDQKPHKSTRSRKAKKPRSQKAKKPRSRKAKKPRSQKAKKPKSQNRKNTILKQIPLQRKLRRDRLNIMMAWEKLSQKCRIPFSWVPNASHYSGPLDDKEPGTVGSVGMRLKQRSPKSAVLRDKGGVSVYCSMEFENKSEKERISKQGKMEPQRTRNGNRIVGCSFLNPLDVPFPCDVFHSKTGQIGQAPVTLALLCSPLRPLAPCCASPWQSESPLPP